VKKQIAAVLALIALAAVAACSSTPTANDAATPADWQANDVPSEAPQDTTTGRGPNLFGSGN
jgi:ABC-type glycerol-3-phosphate transport system substrate-binding protein